MKTFLAPWTEMKTRLTLVGLMPRVAVLGLLVLAWCAPAFSQGCAMCYSSAVAASKEGQRAISKGVLVLVIPPAGFMTVGIGVAYWYGKKRDRENN